MVSNDEMKTMFCFFSKLHGTVYFLYNDIASIDIDFDRCVFSSSSSRFFSFFCSDIHRHDIDFLFLRCGSVHIFLDIIFFKTFFLFFFLKLFDFSISFFLLQNKKQKEQKNINDITYLFYLVHNDKLCVFVYVWLGVQVHSVLFDRYYHQNKCEEKSSILIISRYVLFYNFPISIFSKTNCSRNHYLKFWMLLITFFVYFFIRFLEANYIFFMK